MSITPTFGAARYRTAQTIADNGDAADFRSRVSDFENASMWQSLSCKANYKAAY